MEGKKSWLDISMQSGRLELRARVLAFAMRYLQRVSR